MVRVRVLVVEDSLTVRKYLVETLDNDPSIEVVGEAGDGEAAVRLCHSLRPDVVTLDLALPRMNGLEVTEHIMAWDPTPIVIVSASTNRAGVLKTLDALAAGAVEVLDKASPETADEAWRQRFIDTIKIVSRIKVITHPRARLRSGSPVRRSVRVLPPVASASPLRVAALGASTGGPGAVLDILKELPADYPLPVLVVIHVNEPFGRAMVEWLDPQCALPIRTAVNGEMLPSGRGAGVYLADGDRHLTVKGGRIWLTQDAPRNFCRPSVDVLFESLARDVGAAAVGCLLTGMGRDGAQGLLAMREAGAVTVAQDEATCMVYGMPREAVALDAAIHVLALREIAPLLVSLGAVEGRQR